MIWGNLICTYNISLKYWKIDVYTSVYNAMTFSNAKKINSVKVFLEICIVDLVNQQLDYPLKTMRT